MDKTIELFRDIEAERDDLLEPTYNPLRYALSNDDDSKNDIFSRIDRCLGSVIDSTFKGFSSSVFTYNAICEANRNCLEDLQKIKFYIDRIKKTIDVDLTQIERLKYEMRVREHTGSIYKKIEFVLNLISSEPQSELSEVVFDEQDRKADTLKRAQDLVRAEEVCLTISSLSFVRDLVSQISEEKTVLLKVICENICLFILENYPVGFQSIKALFLLDGYEQIVHLFEDSLPKNMSQQVEKALYCALKESDSHQGVEYQKLNFQDIFSVNNEQFVNNDLQNSSTAYSADSEFSDSRSEESMHAPCTMPELQQETNLTNTLARLQNTRNSDMNCVYKLWKSTTRAEPFSPTKRLIAQNLSNYFASMLENYLSIHKKLQSQYKQTSVFIERNVNPKILESPKIFYKISVDCLKKVLDTRKKGKPSFDGFSLDCINEEINLDLVLGDLSIETSNSQKGISQGSDFMSYEFDLNFDFEMLYLLYLTLPESFRVHFYEFLEETFLSEKYTRLRKRISALSIVQLHNTLPNLRFSILPAILDILHKFRNFHEVKSCKNLFSSLLDQSLAIFHDFTHDEFSQQLLKKMVLDIKGLDFSSKFDFVGFYDIEQQDHAICHSNNFLQSSSHEEQYSIPLDSYSPGKSHYDSPQFSLEKGVQQCQDRSLENSHSINLDSNNRFSGSGNVSNNNQTARKSSYSGSNNKTNKNHVTRNYPSYDQAKEPDASLHGIALSHARFSDTDIPENMIPSLKEAYCPQKQKGPKCEYKIKHAFDENSEFYQEYISKYTHKTPEEELLIKDDSKYSLYAALFYTLYDLVSIYRFETSNFEKSTRDVFIDSKISGISRLLHKAYLCINITVFSTIIHHFDSMVKNVSKCQRSKSLRIIMSIFQKIRDAGLVQIINIQLLSHSLSQILTNCEEHLYIKKIDDLYDLLRDICSINGFILECSDLEDSYITSNIRYFQDVLQDKCDNAAKIGLRKRLLLPN